MIYNNCFIINNKDILSKIGLNRIMYFTNIDINSEFFTDTLNNYCYEKTLSQIEKELKKDCFFRVHCNYIVNMRYITEINLVNNPYIVINNKVKIPISLRRKCVFLRKVKDFYNYLLNANYQNN